MTVEADPPQIALALDDALYGLSCALGCVRTPDGAIADHGAEPLDLHRKIHRARATLDEIERCLVGERDAESCFGCNAPGRLRGQPRPAHNQILDLHQLDLGVVLLCRTCARKNDQARG